VCGSARLSVFGFVVWFVVLLVGVVVTVTWDPFWLLRLRC